MRQRLIALLLVFGLIVSLAACGDNGENNGNDNNAPTNNGQTSEQNNNNNNNNDNNNEETSDRITLGDTFSTRGVLDITFGTDVEIVPLLRTINVYLDSERNQINTDRAIVIPISVVNTTEDRFGQLMLSGIWNPYNASLNLNRMGLSDPGLMQRVSPAHINPEDIERFPLVLNEFGPGDEFEGYMWIPYAGTGEYRIGFAEAAGRIVPVYFTID